MLHFLPALSAGVAHDAKSALGIRVAAFLRRQFRDEQHDAPHQRGMAIFQMRNRGNVFFRDHQKCTGAQGLMS